MANKGTTTNPAAKPAPATPPANAAKTGKPSALLDTRVAYCGHNVEQLADDTDDRFPTPLIRPSHR